MMSKARSVIVIPVYKRDMTSLEVFSLLRCRKVLKDPVVFVGPQGLDFRGYRTHYPDASVVTFDAVYFSTIETYSALLLAPIFYEAFRDFGYLLVHQLDAWVFEDQMDYWCCQGYDYIGAPWLGDDGTWRGVGNGGFSLRKVARCLDVLNSDLREDPDEYWAYICRFVPGGLSRTLHYHRKVLKHLGIRADVRSFLAKFIKAGCPEDMFWGHHAVRFSPSFHVAPVAEALCFSIEGGLEKVATAVYAERPPFGCHREWFLKMLYRFVSSSGGAESDYEAAVWRLAELSGMSRAG